MFQLKNLVGLGVVLVGVGMVSTACSNGEPVTCAISMAEEGLNYALIGASVVWENIEQLLDVASTMRGRGGKTTIEMSEG